jgi:hypothetical protein
MASPWDDVRRESLEMPAVGARRPSPLPWMLLTVSIALTVGVLTLGRTRLEEERTRTANALKANDELKAKLKSFETELEAQKSVDAQAEKSVSELKKQLLTLELEKRRLQEELSRRKK